MVEYELRYRQNDGRIALLFITKAPDDEAVREIADEYWKPHYATLEIYRGQRRIRELRNPRALH
jgi:hypothetical protein